MVLLLLSAFSRSLVAVILAGGFYEGTYYDYRIGYIIVFIAFVGVILAVLVNIIITTVSKIRELRPIRLGM